MTLSLGTSLCEASLAKLSASSLPGIPACPGIHINFTHFPKFTSWFKWYLILHVKELDESSEAKAWIELRESVNIRKYFPGVA